MDMLFHVLNADLLDNLCDFDLYMSKLKDHTDLLFLGVIENIRDQIYEF